MAKLVLPRVQAMVVCDSLKQADDETGAFHLHGVRSIIEATSFPALRPRLCIFLHMSGHTGESHCHIEIDRIETGELVFQSAPQAVHFAAPTTVEPVYFRLRNCVFPAPGVYYVQIINEGKLIGERPIQVRSGE